MRSIKNKLRKASLSIIATVLIGCAVLCVAVRIAEVAPDPSIDILAVEMTFPTGNAEYSGLESSNDHQSDPTAGSLESDNEDSAVTAETSEVISKAENSKETSKADSKNKTAEKDDFEASTPTDEEIKKYDDSHKDDEKYPVTEFTTTKGNQSYQNIQIKNASSADIDIKAELAGKLGFTIEDTDEPQVLIYHTHTSESFLKYDTGYFYEGFYPRTTDTSQNVCAVGEEIAKQLNKAGIKTIHDTTVHDYPSYNGAYDRSLDTINDYLKKYPSIKVVLDIHRDGIGTDTAKSKPVFTVNGKKAAQVMILAGYNYDGSDEFSDWEYNLRFALQIQNTASQMYPDMMRPIYFADFMYNMNVNTGSLLIEIGAESNTVEEVRYSGYLLGKVLCKTLKK